VLAAVPGTDAAPQASASRRVDPPVRAGEDTDQGWGETPSGGNDERLRRDVPPHWG